MKKAATTILVLGLLLPMSIAVLGYCLDPRTSGYETIGLGAVLLICALVAALLLRPHTGEKP